MFLARCRSLLVTHFWSRWGAAAAAQSGGDRALRGAAQDGSAQPSDGRPGGRLLQVQRGPHWLRPDLQGAVLETLNPKP
eukprot:8306903-Pyramimonas_sp.AAC.1